MKKNAALVLEYTNIILVRKEQDGQEEWDMRDYRDGSRPRRAEHCFILDQNTGQGTSVFQTRIHKIRTPDAISFIQPDLR